MRLRLISTAFAICLLPAVANAQAIIDMSAFTCDQYLAMSPAMSRDFSAWMSGWFSNQSGRRVVDVLVHQKNIAIVKSWCQSHPQASVMVPCRARLARSDILDPGRVAMRWNVLFVAATLLVAASLPSAAQISIDMNKITCGRWLGYSPEERDFVRFWMSGYYNSAANSKILNYDRFQRNSAKVAGYCKSHKSQTLPTAIKNLGLWQ